MKLIQAFISVSGITLLCKDDRGQLPLHIACQRNHEEIIALIMHYTPDCNAIKDYKRRFPSKCTPKHIKAENEKENKDKSGEEVTIK